MDVSTSFPLLSTVIFLPGIGALITLFIKKPGSVSTLILLITFLISLILPLQFDSDRSDYQFQDSNTWISSLGVQYKVGLDGLNLWLLELTIFIGLIGVMYANFVERLKSRSFYVSILLLITAISGVFSSIDLFLFLIFLGASLAPPFIIQSSLERNRARSIAMRQLYFHLTGFLLILGGFIAFYIIHLRMTGVTTFDWDIIQKISVPLEFQKKIFWVLFVGFAIRMPVIPLHGWLADTVYISPPAYSVFSMAVMIKIGIYGLIRFIIPGCPDAVLLYSPILVYIALINIIYGAFVAIVQPDMKKLLAFSCISQIGFVLLGVSMLSPTGFAGSILHLVNHGIAFTALFLPVAWISHRYKSTLIMDYGGLKYHHPALSTFIVITALAYLGLPGLNCFPSLFMILTTAVWSQTIWSFIALAGVILTAAYLLWFVQRVCYDKKSDLYFEDTRNGHFMFSMVLGLVFTCILWLGLFPQTFLTTGNKAIRQIDRIVQSHRVLQYSSPKIKPDSPSLKARPQSLNKKPVHGK